MTTAGFARHRECTDQLVRAVLRAAGPARLTRSALEQFPPRRASQVIAVGKAGAGMYDGYVFARGEPASRTVVIPSDSHGPTWALRASHPTPDERSVRAATHIREQIESSPVDQGIVLLLSGGASALAALPAPGLSVGVLRAVTDGLLRSGADIRELNWVRKHLEQLKGGRLAALAAPRALDVYILSDVIGDDIAVIGSGPAWPDGSTFADALEILTRRAVEVPAARRFLEEGAAGKHPDTPKPGDPVFRSVRNGIVGNNATAVEAARAAAEEMGFRTRTLSKPLAGEAAAEGALLARMLPPRGRACLVGGGETTVNVGDTAGRGGRNQELALAAALEIDSREGVAIMAFATDGVDGATNAAGAVVSGDTCRLAKEAGLHPGKSLRQHDSHGFFEALERAGHPCLIRTGPTGTNVNDVVAALVF